MSKKASLKHSVSEDMMFERTNTVYVHWKNYMCSDNISRVFSYSQSIFYIWKSTLPVFGGQTEFVYIVL